MVKIIPPWGCASSSNYKWSILKQFPWICSQGLLFNINICNRIFIEHLNRKFKRRTLNHHTRTNTNKKQILLSSNNHQLTSIPFSLYQSGVCLSPPDPTHVWNPYNNTFQRHAIISCSQLFETRIFKFNFS